MHRPVEGERVVGIGGVDPLRVPGADHCLGQRRQDGGGDLPVIGMSIGERMGDDDGREAAGDQLVHGGGGHRAVQGVKPDAEDGRAGLGFGHPRGLVPRDGQGDRRVTGVQRERPAGPQLAVVWVGHDSEHRDGLAWSAGAGVHHSVPGMGAVAAAGEAGRRQRPSRAMTSPGIGSGVVAAPAGAAGRGRPVRMLDH